MMLRMATGNLGHGSPGQSASGERLTAWLDELRDGDVQLLFLQEMPLDESWTEELARRGWALVDGCGPRYRCRSGVAVHESLGTWRPIDLPTSDYHGSYLAAAVVETPADVIVAVSVHASPTPLSQRDHDLWTWGDPPLRRGAPGDPAVWDSDHVLQTVGMAMAEEVGPVIVGGDLNEARRWDDDHAGHWGEDWFAIANGIGMHDATFSLWGEERPTHGRYQVDHVLVSESVASGLRTASFGPCPGGDHASLIVELDL